MPKGIYTRTKPGYWAGKKRPDLSKMFTNQPHSSERKEIEKLAAKKRKERGGYIDSQETRIRKKEGQYRRKEKFGYINSPITRIKLAQRVYTPQVQERYKEIGRKVGKTNKGRTGILSPSYGRTPSPKCSRGCRNYFDVPNQGKVYLRSSWELLFAKYLVDKQVDFRYEYKRFVLDAKTYLPDFYLVKEDKFIEVKGFVSKNAIQKMKEMKIFHPDIKIEMICKKEIDKIRNGEFVL